MSLSSAVVSASTTAGPFAFSSPSTMAAAILFSIASSPKVPRCGPHHSCECAHSGSDVCLIPRQTTTICLHERDDLLLDELAKESQRVDQRKLACPQNPFQRSGFVDQGEEKERSLLERERFDLGRAQQNDRSPAVVEQVVGD